MSATDTPISDLSILAYQDLPAREKAAVDRLMHLIRTGQVHAGTSANDLTPTQLTAEYEAGTTQAEGPYVGQPATVCYWSDREPATVIAVSPSGYKVTVQIDKATRIDSNGMSDAQTYEYERDPNGSVMSFHRNKRGNYRRSGTGLSLGSRRAFRDFSF